MQQRLALGGEISGCPIRIEIAGEQHALEKYQAGRPHGGRSAEPGQNLFGDNRLYQKKQEGRSENGKGVKDHRRIVACHM